MTDVSKKYRLNSMEEPTDEMLQELMENVAKSCKGVERQGGGGVKA